MSLVYITGPIGAGKSTLTASLRRQGYRFVDEDANKNPFLGRYYSDPHKWAFHAQLWFHIEILKGTGEILETGGDWVVDRPARERYEMFVPYLVSKGYITDFEDTILKDIADTCDELLSPDIIVALDASPEELEKRIRERNRGYESGLTLSWLKDHLSRYQEFWGTLRKEGLLVWDAPSLPADEILAAFNAFYNR